MAIDFLEDILCCSAGLPALLPSEHRASSQLLRMLTKEESDRAREREDLRNVLNMGQQVSLAQFDTDGDQANKRSVLNMYLDQNYHKSPRCWGSRSPQWPRE